MPGAFWNVMKEILSIFRLVEGEILNSRWLRVTCRHLKEDGPLNRSIKLRSTCKEGDFAMYHEFQTTLICCGIREPKLWLPVFFLEGRFCNEVKTNILYVRVEAQRVQKLGATADTLTTTWETGEINPDDEANPRLESSSTILHDLLEIRSFITADPCLSKVFLRWQQELSSWKDMQSSLSIQS